MTPWSAPAIARALGTLKSQRVECGVHFLLWSAFLAVMGTGENNGIGWFQQPAHSLWFPLITGALWNALTFLAAGYGAINALQRRTPGPWLTGLALVAVVVLTGKTMTQWLYIRLAEPSLSDVGFFALAGENAYSFTAMWILGSLYFVFRSALSRDKTPPTRSITVRSGHADHRLAIDDIRYLKSEGNYVAFHTDAAPILALMTMDSAHKLLDDPRFLRIHRSYIANVDHIKRLARGTARVGETDLPIGRTYQAEVKARVAEWVKTTDE